MPFTGLDTAAASRALSLLVEHSGDVVDAFFERSELIEVPAEGEPPGIRCWRESGLAVRLLRDREIWAVSCDGFARDALRDAIRRVARSYPRTAFPLPDLDLKAGSRVDEDLGALVRLPSQLATSLRVRRVAFPMRVKTRRHRRQIQVIGPRVVAPVEEESYYSVVVETQWQSFGDLFGNVTPIHVEPLADRLVEAFRAREAPPPTEGVTTLVLGHHAAAVLLHEGVAHALEADTLAATGPPEAALGIELASSLVSVVDDPGAAPDGVKRQTDDEGMPVVRRWLLRDGVVEQILADRSYSERCGRFEPGAGRRSDRHQRLGPRSTYLEMLPGRDNLESLIQGAGEGLYAPEADRGLLDPRTGFFLVSFPYGRRIRRGVLAEPVGRFLIRARVADLLSRVIAVGGESAAGGAGWCAKGGQRLPVWASTAPLVIEAAEVEV